MHQDWANHNNNFHKIFLKAELKSNDCPLVCLGKLSAQTQIGLNGIIFAMAIKLDAP